MQAKKFIIGDVHGHLNKLLNLLKQHQLIDSTGNWTGGTKNLYLLGDLTDRGPNGIGVIDFLMALQSQALNDGGQVEVLIGNHDVAMVTASRFPNKKTSGPSGTFLLEWLRVGGDETELSSLTSQQITWLSERPALVQLNGTLLMHADTPMYLHYGSSINTINEAICNLINSDDIESLDTLRVRFREHHAFSKIPAKAHNILSLLQATKLIHGHVPISTICDMKPESVTNAYVYADGACTNIDGGMYLGGPGFVYIHE